MCTCFCASRRPIRYDRKCLFSCIYNPQTIISPISSFSASFNGNRVKNHAKPWTYPLRNGSRNMPSFKCGHLHRHTHTLTPCSPHNPPPQPPLPSPPPPTPRPRASARPRSPAYGDGRTGEKDVTTLGGIGDEDENRQVELKDLQRTGR